MTTPIRRALRWLAILLVAAGFMLWGWLDHFSLAPDLDWSEPREMVALAKASGAAGPLVIVAAMAVAILFSPLPSAPIAMAAGAIYGHFEGTLYVFIGALLGASGAFAIARMLGFDAARRWLEQRFPGWKLADQRRLMWLVLLSRLVPFISFDLVSYAAGITALTFGRFLVATAIGILPASFLLAHFGERALEHSFAVNAAIVVLLLIGTLILQRVLKRRG